MNRRSGDLNKSRYGRVSTKRKFSEEFDSVATESTKTNSIHLAKKNKLQLNSSTSNNSNSNLQYSKINGFSIGDIVWAKVGKYPVWPGIIISDPESNRFSKKENKVPMLHVYYCNDMYKRNWIKLNQVYKFSGRTKILQEYPKIPTQINRSKIKMKWNKAVDEAEYLAAMNKEDRITAYFANNFCPHLHESLTNSSEDDEIDIKPKVEVYTNNSSWTENPSIENSTDIVSTKSEYESMNNIILPNHNKQIVEKLPKDHPRILIPELCKLFYSNGWVTGTGGGISIKYNDQIFIAPSGVQKERMESEDLFVQDIKGKDIAMPSSEKNLSKSQCTPIFMCAYTERNAGAVIHIHSPEVVKLCLLNPENELKISGLEMIKGIYNEKKQRFYDNDEEVIIPIIENSKYEIDLVDSFKKTLKKYPSTSAILVRNHGMYVWGKDWKSAKTQCECYEYVFNIMVFKKIHNL